MTAKKIYVASKDALRLPTKLLFLIMNCNGIFIDIFIFKLNDYKFLYILFHLNDY